MDSLIGVVGKDFVLLVNDTGLIAYGAILVQSNVDKLYRLSDRIGMLVCGEAGDTNQFAEFICRNIQLYKISTGHELSPFAAANFTRKQTAESLRTREHLFVNLLIGGYDAFEKRPELFAMDYLGSLHKAPFAYQGFCQYFGLALADRYWKPDMNLDEALTFVNNIICEISTRFLINNRCFFVRKIDVDGIHTLDNIYPPKMEVERPLSYALLDNSGERMEEVAIS